MSIQVMLVEVGTRVGSSSQIVLYHLALCFFSFTAEYWKEKRKDIKRIVVVEQGSNHTKQLKVCVSYLIIDAHCSESLINITELSYYRYFCPLSLNSHCLAFFSF